MKHGTMIVHSGSGVRRIRTVIVIGIAAALLSACTESKQIDYAIKTPFGTFYKSGPETTGTVSIDLTDELTGILSPKKQLEK